jgi:hypothetical protein
VTRSFDNMAIAQARIAEEANRRTGTLDLSDLGLEELPEELFELRHLRVLDELWRNLGDEVFRRRCVMSVR